ncbi:MAG TPA: response regulator [Ohtaekwangia sp.]|uniref:response regulator n=1 Tax=Ohtaekwangia sp. TaxID=2066019 RepID=UPI002F92280B
MLFLIIDDDPEDVDYFVETARRVIPDCDCLTASSCEEGFRMLREAVHIPSYIFLDGMLYGMNSKECLRKLKKDPLYTDIRIIMYSGFAHEELQLEFLKMGADKFIIKPTSSTELEHALIALLSEKK